jgi:hypothetical protein
MRRLTWEERGALIDSGRIRRLLIGFEMWSEFVRGTLSAVSWSTCPQDLQVLGIQDARRGAIPSWADIEVLVWSASFEPVEKGSMIPEIDNIIYGVEYLRLRSTPPDMSEKREGE